MKDKIFKCIIISTVILISIVYIGNYVSVKMDEYILISEKVIEAAKHDTGENCTVKSIHYDYSNKEYQVKVVNEKETREITYVAMITNDKANECYVEKFIEREKIAVKTQE